MRLAEKVFKLFCKSMSARALMICVNVGKWVTDTGTERWSERAACMNTPDNETIINDHNVFQVYPGSKTPGGAGKTHRHTRHRHETAHTNLTNQH
jgi:hypothetical protein